MTIFEYGITCPAGWGRCYMLHDDWLQHVAMAVKFFCQYLLTLAIEFGSSMGTKSSFWLRYEYSIHMCLRTNTLWLCQHNVKDLSLEDLRSLLSIFDLKLWFSSLDSQYSGQYEKRFWFRYRTKWQWLAEIRTRHLTSEKRFFYRLCILLSFPVEVCPFDEPGECSDHNSEIHSLTECEQLD